MVASVRANSEPFCTHPLRSGKVRVSRRSVSFARFVDAMRLERAFVAWDNRPDHIGGRAMRGASTSSRSLLAGRPVMMARPLPLDLRRPVADALRDGMTVRAAAVRFGISVATAVRIGQLQHSDRSLAPGKMGGSRPADRGGRRRHCHSRLHHSVGAPSPSTELKPSGTARVQLAVRRGSPAFFAGLPVVTNQLTFQPYPADLRATI